MRIIREFVETQPLISFADQHQLTMRISERLLDRWQRTQCLKRFVAHFESVEVKDGVLLRGVYGEGNTEAEAIRDYAGRISDQLIVFSAYSDDRKEIPVPRLTCEDLPS